MQCLMLLSLQGHTQEVWKKKKKEKGNPNFKPLQFSEEFALNLTVK